MSVAYGDRGVFVFLLLKFDFFRTLSARSRAHPWRWIENWNKFETRLGNEAKNRTSDQVPLEDLEHLLSTLA